MPNMYARGILWGKMVLELGDACTARNEKNGYYADLQFKTKVRFSVFLNPEFVLISRGCAFLPRAKFCRWVGVFLGDV